MIPSATLSEICRECSIDGCGRHVYARELCQRHYDKFRRRGTLESAPTKHSPVGAAMEFINSLPSSGDGCLIWPFGRSSTGYGTLRLPGRGMQRAHRVACERVNGPPPTSKHHAAHACGRGHLGCVAPWHLSWKTPAENCADKLLHGTHQIGEQNSFAKLTEAEVHNIRALEAKASLSALGERFGLSKTHVSRIIRGKAWAHVS